MAELNGNNGVLRRYIHGSNVDSPLVWMEGGGTGDRRFYHADHQGSIIALSDSTGGVLHTTSYSPYGVPDGLMPGRFAYTGQAVLPGLDLYHYKARVYSPTLGRFLQTDPIGYEDQQNWYAYVGNDPMNATDPTGMETRFLQADAWIAFLFGGEVSIGFYYTQPSDTAEKWDVGVFVSHGSGVGVGGGAGVDVGRRDGDYSGMRGTSDDFSADGIVSVSIMTEEGTGQGPGGSYKTYEPTGAHVGGGPGAGVSWFETDTTVISVREIYDVGMLVSGIDPETGKTIMVEPNIENED